MTPENPYQRKPYEIFGLTLEEATRMRVTDARLKEILARQDTTTHTLELSTNAFGEFLFITTSRGSGPGRICITFYGYGFHEYRERWLSKEWFWYQSQESLVELGTQIPGEEIKEKLGQRLAEISPFLGEETQTETGRLFEELADMSDDDAALAEMQDLGLL